MPLPETSRFLITGATGQIGTELTTLLRRQVGGENVIASGRSTRPPAELAVSGPFEWVDVTDRVRLMEVVEGHRIDVIISLAALLSAEGEDNPQLAWDVNVNGLLNCLEVARELQLLQVLAPSSIAVFGPESPKDPAPQETVLRPSTMYGISKVAGELLCDYYAEKFGVDARGVRFPGIISSKALPGGGTTDFAVEMFYKAVEGKPYACFVRADTRLPMMYMPDCLRAIIDLMNADRDQLTRHGDYNVNAMSFTAGELASAILSYIPGFEVSYEPDERQQIADSWPQSLDDAVARGDWDWQPTYDLETMTIDMIGVLERRHSEGRLYPA